jgi:zinc transport system ATP-binding protein
VSGAKAIVEFDDVGVVYENKVQALKHITFKISKRDFVGLIGPNGAGKSTLINIILGLVEPTQGLVRLFGKRIAPESLRRIGYVPQALSSSVMNFPATVFETVLLGRIPNAGLFHRLKREDRQKAEESLNAVRMASLKDRKLSQLSYGQLQRVFVAKALASEPDLLLLDEPTSGADLQSKIEFFELLKNINSEQGTAILLSSHDVSAVTSLVKKVLCINGNLFFCEVKSKFTRRIRDQAYEYPMVMIEHGSHA